MAEQHDPEGAFDLEGWLAGLPETFDDEFIRGLDAWDCERIEDNDDRLSPAQSEAYRAYMKAHFPSAGNLTAKINAAAAFGLSPGLKNLSRHIAGLSKFEGSPTATPQLAKLRPPVIESPDFDDMAREMAERAERERRERDEQRQREVDTLGALRAIEQVLVEQNVRARRGEWVQDATLGLALIGVGAAIGALAWALYEDRSTAVWTSVVTLVIGGGVLALPPRLLRRRRR